MENVIIIDLHPVSVCLQLIHLIESLYQSISFVSLPLIFNECKNCKQNLTSFYFKKIIVFFIFSIFVFILIFYCIFKTHFCVHIFINSVVYLQFFQYLYSNNVL